MKSRPLPAASAEPSVGLNHAFCGTYAFVATTNIDTHHRPTPNHSLAAADQQMGKAYNQDQRDRVKLLLEAGRDEETIEKETGVSDRTIRRWKMELERTGRIGKPPESRTGRHRVLNPDVETVSGSLETIARI